MRLLTFNLLSLPVVSLSPAGRRRAWRALRLIRELDPDVLVLNEAYGCSAAERILLPRLHSDGYHVVSARRLGNGVYVLSRYRIVRRKWTGYRAARRGTLDALSAMGVLLVRIAAPEPLWLAATHLQADAPLAPKRATHAVRMAQLGELRAALDREVPDTEPVLLAGDLNVDGQDIEAAQQAVGGCLVPANGLPEPTFDGRHNPLVAPGYTAVLDYVAALRGPLRVTASTVRYRAGEVCSDHFPVLAEITREG